MRHSANAIRSEWGGLGGAYEADAVGQNSVTAMPHCCNALAPRSGAAAINAALFQRLIINLSLKVFQFESFIEGFELKGFQRLSMKDSFNLKESFSGRVFHCQWNPLPVESTGRVFQ